MANLEAHTLCCTQRKKQNVLNIAIKLCYEYNLLYISKYLIKKIVMYQIIFKQKVHKTKNGCNKYLRFRMTVLQLNPHLTFPFIVRSFVQSINFKLNIGSRLNDVNELATTPTTTTAAATTMTMATTTLQATFFLPMCLLAKIVKKRCPNPHLTH